MTGHMTAPAAALAERLPTWVTLLRAPNPGPMTLDGTNTWILHTPGGRHRIVIDPGPDDAGHLDRIAAHAPVGLVLITHGHPDHTEGSRSLVDRVGGAVPVRAVDPAHCLHAAPLTGDGGADLADLLDGFEIEVLDTPGHTADSICLLIRHGDEQVVLTGDTILGRGTTVVAHPDGDLGDYLASLTALGAYRGVPALPGHGPALADCGAAAAFYLAHRRARLDQVRQAVAEGAEGATEVVARVYADVDRSLWWAAEWSVRAQLAYLEREQRAGRAQRRSDPGVGGLDRP